MELIEKEAARMDGPADEELISACLDLMERLQGRRYEDDDAKAAALNARIAQAIQEKQQKNAQRQHLFHLIGGIAAAIVLIVAIGMPLRWTWFESWSTPDEQQHVIMGHEITVDMVASALAENESKNPITVADFAEFEKHLGFDPGIPSILEDVWVADSGMIRYFSGYISIVATYLNSEASEKSLTCTINYFTDVELAYFSFEQNYEGAQMNIQGMDIYLSNNVERNSATWYDSNMYAQVVGLVSSEEATDLLLRLLGVLYD